MVSCPNHKTSQGIEPSWARSGKQDPNGQQTGYHLQLLVTAARPWRLDQRQQSAHDFAPDSILFGHKGIQPPSLVRPAPVRTALEVIQRAEFKVSLLDRSPLLVPEDQAQVIRFKALLVQYNEPRRSVLRYLPDRICVMFILRLALVLVSPDEPLCDGLRPSNAVCCNS